MGFYWALVHTKELGSLVTGFKSKAILHTDNEHHSGVSVTFLAFSL